MKKGIIKSVKRPSKQNNLNPATDHVSVMEPIYVHMSIRKFVYDGIYLN